MPNSIEKIIKGLEAARQKKPDMIDVIDLHCALLTRQGQVTSAPAPVLPTPDEIEQALRQGAPLLTLTPLSFDWQAITQLTADICQIIAKHRPDLTDNLAATSHLLTSQNGQIKQVITQYLNGESLNITVDESHSIDPNLLTFVLNQTLHPFLQAQSQTLQAKIQSIPTNEEKDSKSKIDLWGRPNCPMCAGPPDFAALVSKKSYEIYGRQLLCARCDMEWGYQHSGCPFCGEAEQWAYFPDENEVFRLYVCEVCHHYLKTVDWRETFAHRSLPVARVITLNMDVAAVEAGYM